MVAWHGPWQDGRSRAVLAPATGSGSLLLCAEGVTQRHLLGEISFTSADIASLQRMVELWERTWLCYRPAQPVNPDLVFVFGYGNLSEAAHSAVQERVAALLAAPVVRACFGTVRIEFAHISGARDIHDKRRLHTNWTVGPNNLFRHFARLAAARGYRCTRPL